jgi:APA family basic amino acid/polyamine antiporter
MLACLGLVFGLERSNWLRLAIWLAIGLVVYFGYGYRRSVLRNRLAAGGPAAR